MFLLSSSYLGLWGNRFDACHVAGNWQDAELVVNDNTIFAGCK